LHLICEDAMVRLLGVSLLIVSISGIAFAGSLPVPEIDSSTGVAAMGLLAGGFLILRSRKR
jgi:hypothetical protein